MFVKSLELAQSLESRAHENPSMWDQAKAATRLAWELSRMVDVAENEIEYRRRG